MATRAIDPIDDRHMRMCLAEELLRHLQAGVPLDRQLLLRTSNLVLGEGESWGRWTLREAFDALEIAQLLHLLRPACPLLDGSPRDVLHRLDRFGREKPLQANRSEGQVALQQFSTPPALAFLAGLAARPSASDAMLEPSAGNGQLIWPAARAGSRLLLNEIDEARRETLQVLFPGAAVSPHDAELIGDLLPAGERPSLVMMNPPFARSVGRGVDRLAAARHLCAALSFLAEGGRLVAVMPESFGDHGSVRTLFAKAEATAALRMNLLLAPGLFARQGTGVAVRLVVFDKRPSDAKPQAGAVQTLDEVLDCIERLPPRPNAAPGQVEAASCAQAHSMFRRAARRLEPRAGAMRSPGSHQEVSYEVLDVAAQPGAEAGLYLTYHPSRIRIDGAASHPTPLVESMAMGAIAAPRPGYRPWLPPGCVSEGLLSDAQLESLVYAGTSFERDLPGCFLSAEEGCRLEPAEEGAAYRRGFFLGDGTGGGKGRQIAAIILDQWLRGSRRHLWISKNESLLEDARRDWCALGGLALDIQPLSAWRLGEELPARDLILFITYPALRSGRSDATRLQQIVDWAGRDFEGVIAFDEAHAMANVAGGEASRGRSKGSEQGIAGVRLQNLLPRARVLYASATGASDVNNLAYATRLGLWGPATAFANREHFVEGIRKGGLAAMELVARDLKAQGLYCARALSFAGVEYDILEHPLSADQVRIYDAYANAWAVIHANLERALEATRIVDSASGASLNSNARSAAMSRFEGAKQRFFGQLLLSMKLPTLLPAIANDVAAGHSVVVQLVSTAEAMLDRRLADLSAEEREALDIELSPRELVIDYLSVAFPTRQMRVFTDEEGNVRSEPMCDADGRPVHSREALDARDRLVEQLCALPPISPALDAIIERFGQDQVAEVTGRSRRLIAGANGRQQVERRGKQTNIAETEAFMRGTKKILVFSDAGGTGRSYHACRNAANQSRRIHYLLEPGWRADAAIQGLGRTHRTHQVSAPLFRPVTTNVRGERRFISTIARRLDALGALTRGQRQTGGQNMFDPADNLESSYAKEALLNWYRLLYAGKLRSISLADFQRLSGLRLEGEDGALREDLPPIQRWLNRLLAFRIALQNAIFEEFAGLIEARVEAAREAGTLDIGVETVVVEDFRITGDRVIRTDDQSGATTHLLDLRIRQRSRPMTLTRIQELSTAISNAVPMINRRSGRAALRVAGRSLLAPDGSRIERYRLIRPTGTEHVSLQQFGETNWERAPAPAFAAAWERECEEQAATLRCETLHIASGLLLPVWNKLSDSSVRVIRLLAADGRSLLGRHVGAEELPILEESLGLSSKEKPSPEVIVARVLRDGATRPVAGPDPLQLKRSLVNGSQRLELIGFEPGRLAWYKSLGCFTEIIRYRTRLFVPANRATAILAHLALPQVSRTPSNAEARAEDMSPADAFTDGGRGEEAGRE